MSMPLNNITVIDTTVRFPGAFCSQILADLGARVIKVEPPGGDPLRDYDLGVFTSVNHNKTLLELNLKNRGGSSTVLGNLISQADVFLEGSRPGVAKRLGIDYNTLSEVKPDLIYCSISGYGQVSGMAAEPGYEINCHSMSGALSVSGHLGKKAGRSGLPVGDLSAANYACIGVLAALRHRDLTGEGSYIDVSMRDALVSWLSSRVGDNWNRDAPPNRHLEVTNDIFEGSDGASFAIAVSGQRFWVKIRDVVAPVAPAVLSPIFEDDSGRRANAKKLRDILEAVFVTRAAWEWVELLRAVDIPASPVLSTRDVASDPELRRRGVIEKIGNAHFARSPIVRNGRTWVVPFKQSTTLKAGELGHVSLDHVE